MGRNDKKENLLERAADLFDLPGEVLAGMPLITITGGVRIHIENHRGILEYGETEIDVNCGKVVVRLSGEKMELRAMSENELLITGELARVEFIR